MKKDKDYSTFEKEVLSKLDLLVRTIIHSNINPNTPQTETILQLKKFGLQPNQIADILNTTQNYVNVTLSKTKQKKSKKNAKRKK